MCFLLQAKIFFSEFQSNFHSEGDQKLFFCSQSHALSQKLAQNSKRKAVLKRLIYFIKRQGAIQ